MSGENIQILNIEGCGEKHMHLTDSDRQQAQKDFDEIVNDPYFSKIGKISMLDEKIMKYTHECERYAQNSMKVSDLADKYHLIGESLKNMRLANALRGLCHRREFVPHGSVSPIGTMMDKQYRESPFYV